MAAMTISPPDDQLNAALAAILRAKGWQPVWASITASGDGAKPLVSVIPGTTGPAPFGSEGQQFPGAHLALRPPQTVKIFDVDHYENKHGMDTIDRAQQDLGPLPPTWRISARGAGNPSGRYLYRCPEGAEFSDSALLAYGEEDTRGGKTRVFTDVEIVRTRHRFSWAPGTLHYKNGQPIEVYDADDELSYLPSVDELPELPRKWAEYLSSPQRKESDPSFRPDPATYAAGTEWYLAQPDHSLGSRSELCDFAFWLMTSTHNNRDFVIGQLERVAVNTDPSDPWLRRDFEQMTDSNTQGKTAEFNARYRDIEIIGDTGQPVLAPPPAPPAPPVPPQPSASPPPVPVPASDYDDEEEGYYDDMFPAAPAVPETAQVPEIVLPEFYSLMPDAYKTEYVKQATSRQAKLDLERVVRKVQGTEWKAMNNGRGGFTNPFDAPDPPEPSTFKVVSAENTTSCLITENTVTVLYGNRASGKTWVAATWARQEVTAGNHVMWLDFERQASLMKKKLKALGMPEHRAASLFHYSGAGLPPVEHLAELCREYNPEGSGKRVLVVIDSFRDLLNAVVPSGDSNSGESVSKVYAEYLNFLIAAGATVCLIDHAPKSNTDSAFGSERKESAADNVLKVEMKEKFVVNHSGYSVVTVTKDRYGVAPVTPEGEPWPAYLWVPGDDDVPKGKAGISKYPLEPELRNWAPPSQADLDEAARGTGNPRNDDVFSILGDGMKRAAEIIDTLQAMDRSRRKADRVWLRLKGNSAGAKKGDVMSRDDIGKHLHNMRSAGYLTMDSAGMYEVARTVLAPAAPGSVPVPDLTLAEDEENES